MGVKVLKQKPSQADAILPCVSLSFRRLQVPRYCAVQQCSKPVLFLASLFSLSLSREEEEEEGGRRWKKQKEKEDLRCHFIGTYQQEVTVARSSSSLLSYSKESLIDL